MHDRKQGIEDTPYEVPGAVRGVRLTMGTVTHLVDQVTKGEEGWTVSLTEWLPSGRRKPMTVNEFRSFPRGDSPIHKVILKISKGSFRAEVDINGPTEIRVVCPNEDWALATRDRLVESLLTCQPGIARWAVRIRPVLFGLGCMMAILTVLELLRPDLLAAGKAGLSAVVSFLMYWHLGYSTRSCIVLKQPDRAAVRETIRLVLQAITLAVSIVQYLGS